MRRRSLFALLWSAALFGALNLSCADVPRGSTARNNLSQMQTAQITIVNSVGTRHTIDAWLAREQHEMQLGLMNVPADELPSGRGMLFVFDYDHVLGFWMRNTIIPLDIAYIRSDGMIVRTLTMQALDERSYSSMEPARFALEVRAGDLSARGIAAGDHVEIPQSVLNPGS